MANKCVLWFFPPLSGRRRSILIASFLSFFILTYSGVSSGAGVSAVYEVKVLLSGSSTPLFCSGLPKECSITFDQLVSNLESSDFESRLRKAGYNKVRLVFERGVYRLLVPWSLKWKGDVALDIVGDGVTLTGARLLDFSKVSNEKFLTEAGFSRAAVGKLWVASIQSLNLVPREAAVGFLLPIVPTQGELIFRGIPQPLASWPNSGFGRIVERKGILVDGAREFYVEGRDASDWSNESQMRLRGFWSKDWAEQTFSARVIKEPIAYLRLSGSPFQGVIRGGQRVRVENALCELDSEGEWFVDYRAHLIYWWPPEKYDGHGAEFSSVDKLLVVTDSWNVRVSGFKLEGARGDAVSIEGGGNVQLDRVSVRNVGNRAVVISGGIANGIINSKVEAVGEGGVAISGGDRPGLIPSGNYVVNTDIANFNRLVRTYRPGVHVSGVGASVYNNKIHDSSHSAIIFTGNEHRIVGNEIFRVVNEVSDSGAIYGGRDYSAMGTLIERNYLHDIGFGGFSDDVKGIYVDDIGSGVTINQNLFFRVKKPVYIGGGRENKVSFNYFIESSPSYHLDARGVEWLKPALNKADGEFLVRLNAVPYSSDLWAARYPKLTKLTGDDFGTPKYNVFCGNVIVQGGGLDVSDRAKAGVRVFGNVFESDFGSPEAGVLKLRQMQLDGVNLSRGVCE